MHCGTLQNTVDGLEAVCPVRIASFPPRKSMPPRRGMPSGRRVRRGRAVSAGRLIARLRRPWHRGSRRRRDAEQYSTARARCGRREKNERSECKPPWISCAPPIFAWMDHLHAYPHTAPRGCGVSARYNPDLTIPRYRAAHSWVHRS